jgi:hypothetical protein
MHEGEHEEEKGRLEEDNSYYLFKIRIGRNVVEKIASTLGGENHDVHGL